MAPPGDAEPAQSGMALVCFAEDFGCSRAATARALQTAGSRTIESEIARDFLNIPGKPQRYVIVIVPPRR
jgi:hypothetical protein